jgi:hypothetical protein
MKKVMFVALLAISASASFAQSNIKKADWMVGGSVGFSSSKYQDAEGTYKEFNLSPDAGYFFINQLAGGVRVNLNSSSYEDATTEKNTHVMISPFVRYYFLPSTQKLNVFADASYGMGSVKSIGLGTNKYKISGFAGTAGVAYFITPATALEFSLSYNSSKEEGASQRYNTMMTGLGLQIHLPGKK